MIGIFLRRIFTDIFWLRKIFILERISHSQEMTFAAVAFSIRKSIKVSMDFPRIDYEMIIKPCLFVYLCAACVWDCFNSYVSVGIWSFCGTFQPKGANENCNWSHFGCNSYERVLIETVTRTSISCTHAHIHTAGAKYSLSENCNKHTNPYSNSCTCTKWF